MNTVSPTTKRYPIHSAAKSNDLQLVRLLVKKGVDLRLKCEYKKRSQSVSASAQASSARAEMQEMREKEPSGRVSFSGRDDEPSSGGTSEELDGDEGDVNSQIGSVPLPDEGYAMGIAARHGYFDVLKELVLNCWQFTNLHTSLAAGVALDYAFHIALRDKQFDQAIDLMVACWRRNDLKFSKCTYVVTIYYALSVVRAVRKHVRQEQVRRLL